MASLLLIWLSSLVACCILILVELEIAYSMQSLKVITPSREVWPEAGTAVPLPNAAAMMICRNILQVFIVRCFNVPCQNITLSVPFVLSGLFSI
jgi:hypothetical protein